MNIIIEAVHAELPKMAGELTSRIAAVEIQIRESDTSWAHQSELRRLMSQLDRVHDAQQRVQNDEFGSCMQCKLPIPTERLRLIPYAEHCVPCSQDASTNQILTPTITWL